MYLSFYNLKVKPFQMSTDPDFLWLGEQHKEALAILKYAIMENKGVLALTGDVGTGKTTLINALIQSLGEDTLAATIYDPSLEVLEFFNVVATAFGMGETFESKGQFIIRFREFLKDARERKQKVLLIVDEAQALGPELLEEIRLLSNLEQEHIRLLNIFFVGQNEFVDILQEYRNRALRQRITIRYHIEQLTLDETESYMRHRLKVSGTEATIFSPGALDEIFAFSGGYPVTRLTMSSMAFSISDDSTAGMDGGASAATSFWGSGIGEGFGGSTGFGDGCGKTCVGAGMEGMLSPVIMVVLK